MKPLFHSITCLAMALFGLSAAVPVEAQTGKKGTVVKFDKSTAHGLFTSAAYGPNADDQPFGYLKHDISPVQMVVSNDSKLKSDGSGFYASVANNFTFEGETLSLENVVNTGDPLSPRLAIIAPKGYRFVGYDFDLQCSTADGVSFQQVVYNANGEEMDASEAVALKASSGVKNMQGAFTFEEGSNVLYFRMSVTSTKSQQLLFKKLKLVYAIDNPYTAQLPDADGETNVATGVFDMGKFRRYYSAHWTYNGVNYANANGGKGYWGFRQSGISDKQAATIWNNGAAVEADVATVNDEHYYVAATEGDYYVEAPKKFRIVGATLNFLRQDATGKRSTTTSVATSVVSTPSVKGKYVISDGKGHYLSKYDYTLDVDEDASVASKWFVESGNSSAGWVVGDSSYYHLYYATDKRTGKYAVSVYISSSSWMYSESNGLYFTTGSGNRATTYYLAYDEASGWILTTTKPSNVVRLYSVSGGDSQESAVSYVAGDFTATVYGRDGESVSQTVSLSEAENSATVDLSDFNNDAVRFSISGLGEGKTALYSVNLHLLPLNPELQNLSVGSKFGNNEGFESTTSFDSENYDFNNGDAVSIVMPEAVANENGECTVEFLNADNEEKTKWYTDGSLENNTASTGGYSNFFLVGSEADKGTGDNVELDFALGAGKQPDARTSAVKAGLNALDFTNIKNLWDGPDEYLVQNEFKKTEANYGEAKLSTDGTEKEFYIYSADQPTFQILDGSKHIDFRYYTLKVKCVKQVEKPEVTIVPIYKETLKSASRDGKIPSDANTLDTKHTFYGVKVKAVKANNDTKDEVYGYLTSKSIMDAVKEQLQSKNYYGFEEANALRGMLYLDLSDLCRTDDTEFGANFRANVADNFLFFVPKGTSAPTDVTNIVTKTDENVFEANSNIVVRDQQPFFTPYDFRTSNYYVKYEREGTATAAGGDNKAKVKNMAVVLPFDVPLDGNGYMKSDPSVLYCNIVAADTLTSIRKGDGADLTWAVLADSVVGVQTAEANVPYYVANKAEDGLGFTYNILNAQFRKTGTLSSDGTKVDSFEPLHRKNGTWTTTGSYSGEQVAKDNLRWYFSKDFFWKSGVLKSSNHFNVRPFRAWFETEINYPTQSQFAVVFDRSEFVTDGIGSAAAEAASLQVASGHGFISVAAGVSTKVAVRTLAGQLVYAGNLSAGEARRFNVAKGVYLVNNVKVVVR